jgi:hypothetical protein
MPLDIAAFNSAFSGARHRIRREAGDIAAEQAQLRALIPADASAPDLEWATSLVELLAKPPAPPREWSALYHEAGEIHASAYPDGGTVEEQIAVLEDARRRIWEIADRAEPDEAPHIRAMTRVLEHIERELREPSWPMDDPSGRAG